MSNEARRFGESWGDTETAERAFHSDAPDVDPDLDLTVSDVIRRRGQSGEPIPCGWAPLDSRFRGNGVAPGRIVTIGGPPFSGKTTVVSQILWNISAATASFALFADEGRDQAATKIGQIAGLMQSRIEGDPSRAGDELDAVYGERVLELRKPDTEESTITAYIQHAVERVQWEETKAQIVMVFDSIQTIPLQADEDVNPRLATTAKMRYFRRMAARYGIIFFLTSQSPRASYRNRRAEENSTPMSAFAESAAVEFMSDVAIFLQARDEKSGVTDVYIPKNRLLAPGTAGRKPFAARYDERLSQMVEIDDIVADQQALTEKDTKALERENRRKGEQLAKLRRFFGRLEGDVSASQIAADAGVRKQSVYELLEDLELEGCVRRRQIDGRGGNGTRTVYFKGPNARAN